MDQVLADGDRVALEPGLTMEVVASPGHSVDGLTFRLAERGVVFRGMPSPRRKTSPIYVNKQASLETLDRLASLEAERFCPAWDHAYDRPEARQVITAGKRMILRIDQAVRLGGSHPAPT